ncbi:MAG: tRNA epoxyqueuosine(34) reductase QueG [Anaerolineales bacterium]|nr:MAG: tRNA epoxyqueuosine(34) reductase QueG [Anaerolineales bacterium]
MSERCSTDVRTDQVVAEAHRLGFDLVGIAPARPARHLPAYRRWLASDYHGEMDYLARPDRVERREDPARIIPGARTFVTVALNYFPGQPRPERDEPRGLVSNYAWGSDYHGVMAHRLEQLAQFVADRFSENVRYRVYVDTGPLLERDHAVEAGLGFFGKNTCLISPRLGSWLFLGILLVDVKLQTTHPPAMPSCGTCHRCLDACPTGALVEPYVLDARRCISYLTIELKGAIPRELRPSMGSWVYGCDECQAACPWQRFAHVTREQSFLADTEGRSSPRLAQLLELDEQAFQRRYDGTALARIGRVRLLRNVAVALGNSAGERGTGALVAALGDEERLVRSHAAWALGRRGAEAGIAALSSALSGETDDETREEMQSALELGAR